ncbi:hypothetical protein KY290_001115 [Solanum tuberosum]|uniref:Uncharacterized protein n=1 Tax=Solanum tuberosum TaxID=4113 RepID=A0ABQ7WNG4_SOLTU|nr:hypothetical protein KY290_001115 [Solanum tuberosum]
MEASMLNRIRMLERKNSLFLLSKAKEEYWLEVKTTLNNCGSQKEYYRRFFLEIVPCGGMLSILPRTLWISFP